MGLQRMKEKLRSMYVISRSRKPRLRPLGIRHTDHATPLYPQKLAITSPTSGGRSVGIVRTRTKATELVCYFTTSALIEEYLYEIHYLLYVTPQCNHLEVTVLSELHSHAVNRKFCAIEGDIQHSSIALITFTAHL
jgi:hypothetical protein